MIVHRLKILQEVKIVKQKKIKFSPYVMEEKVGGQIYQGSGVPGLNFECGDGKKRRQASGGCVLTSTTCTNHAPRIASLPSIDRLVDASTRHKFISFMDAFSSYN